MAPTLRHAPRKRVREPLLVRALRFGRSLVVGAGATAADMTTLLVLVAVFHVAPRTANVPSLLVGLTVQFIGARQWVFRAGEGSLKRHLTLFLMVESAALVLNAVIFWLAIGYTPIPYWAARPIGTFLVYVGFSYPLWKRIFRTEAQRAEEAGDEVTVPELAVPPARAPRPPADRDHPGDRGQADGPGANGSGANGADGNGPDRDGHRPADGGAGAPGAARRAHGD